MAVASSPGGRASGGTRPAGIDIQPLSDLELEFLSRGGKPADFALARGEAMFGLSQIEPHLRRDARILEVGAGTGLLSYVLARNGYTLDALEPLGSGFATFGGLLGIVAERRPENLKLIPIGVEELDARDTYDFCFSVNVFEHVMDWREGLTRVNRALAPGGLAVILCPNYDFPYEPHFRIPVLGSKDFTRRTFRGRIERYERENDAEGLWASLNFISAAEVRDYCREDGINMRFDRSIMPQMLHRLGGDTEFKRRQGAFGPLVSAALALGADKIAPRLPMGLQPYLRIVLERPRR